jgi:hypothetical protein
MPRFFYRLAHAREGHCAAIGGKLVKTVQNKEKSYNVSKLRLVEINQNQPVFG